MATTTHVEFNSSDEGGSEDDWDRSFFYRKSSAGQRQAQAIVDNQTEDRQQSKRNSRRLTLVSGAPSSQDTNLMIERTWDAFYSSLGIKDILTECPTGEHVFRYIDTMTRHVKPCARGKPAASLSTIRNIWEYLITILTFRHADFKAQYGERDILRIKTHLDQLVKRGILIKGRWFKKQWAGFLVVKSLAENWLEKSISEGCLCWDRVIHKLLSIILQSALAARSGDIGRSRGYKGFEYLCFKDVELTLAPSTGEIPLSVQQLAGKFTLRFRKGKKDTMNNDDIIFVDPMPDRSLNAVCVIKVLLVLALRLGHVYGRTVEEVLFHTAARNDRTIQWIHPDWPVISQMGANGGPIILDKPAPAKQFTSNVRELALAKGLLGRITAHTLRRGAIRDITHLNTAVAGVATACAALIAGHSKGSENRGVTAQYAGAVQVSTYNLRAESDFVDKFAPKVAMIPFDQRASRNKPKEVDQYMSTYNMDPNNTRQRATAMRNLKMDKIFAWEEAEKNGNISRPPISGTTTPGIAWKEKAQTGTGKTIWSEGLRDENIGKGSGSVNTDSDTGNESDDIETDSDTDEDDSRIDPQLLNLDNINDTSIDEADEVDPKALSALESLILGDGVEDKDEEDSNNTQLWDTTTIEESLVSTQLAFVNPPITLELDTRPLILEPDSFVNWFAKINVFRHARTFAKSVAQRPTGNSRDVPTPFMFHCGVGVCDYRTKIIDNMELHVLNCNGRALAPKSFRCVEDGCSATFRTADVLERHAQLKHAWEDRPCYLCPASGAIYQSNVEWRRHREKVHFTFEEPRRCPLCDTDRLYSHPRTLRKHLRTTHRQTAQQTAVLVPKGPPLLPPKPSYACPVADCARGDKSLNSNGALRLHLVRIHGYTEEQSFQQVPESKKELTMRKKTDKSKAKDKIPKDTWACPVVNCSSKATFRANRDRRRHLTAVHHWTEDEAITSVPLSKAEITRAANQATAGVLSKATVVVPWKCPLQGCLFETKVQTAQSHRKHLETVHTLTEVQAIEYVPLSKAAKTLRAKK